MSFKQQVKQAKAVSKSRKWAGDNVSGRISFISDADYYRKSNLRGGVANAANRAYSAKRGYDISINPQTGKKEMLVRGTSFKRGGVEWAQNYLESPVGGKLSLGGAMASSLSGRIRRQHSKFLSGVAKKYGVDVVYGHSRGAAIAEDMRVPGTRKIALDGATILNSRSTITNIRQRQSFDRFIGLNNRKSVIEKQQTSIRNPRYHRVYNH